MGYTNYWDHATFSDADWKRLQLAARKIIVYYNENSGGSLSWEYDMPSKGPEISDIEIRFNGTWSEGCETFCLTKAATEFTFCKTGRLQYDVVVVAILMAAEHITSAFHWRSDGSCEEGFGQEARLLLQEAGLQDLART
jgi:hypothetical protein